MLDRTKSLRASDAAAAVEEFDLREIINFLWRRWKLIAAVTAVAILVGIAYLGQATPFYTANVQILLEPPKAKVLGQSQVLSDPALDNVAFEGQLAIIRSTVLLRRVVAKEKLINDPEFGAALSSNGWTLFGEIKSFFSEKPAPITRKSPIEANSIGVIPANELAVIGNLQAALDVKRVAPGQANLINIAVASTNPVRAARLANAVSDAYIVDQLDTRFEAAARASAWLTDRVADLRKELRNSEEAVAQFRAQNSLPTSSSGATLSQEQIGQLNGRLVVARTEVAERKAQLEMLQKAESRGPNMAALGDLTNVGAIADLRRQLADLSRQEADLATRYSNKHPSLVNIHAQMHDVRRQIGTEVERAAAKIDEDYQLAKAREEALVKALKEATGQTGLDASKTIALRELERTAAVNSTLFEDFLQRSRITQEQSTFEARDSRVITPALPPLSPSAPRKGPVLVIAAVIGLVGGVVAAAAVELLHTGFTTPHEVEELLNLPVLASLSKQRDVDLIVDGEVATLPALPLLKPTSRFSEALRGLRSGVRMADVDNPPKVLQFASSLPEEGKTTLALCYSASAAQSGSRVLVVDCDLRHPSVSRYFGLEKNKGLVDYLIGEAKIEDVVHFQPATGFWVLPAGGRTQNPPDLLGSERMRSAVEELQTKFDLIVVDTPPMEPVIDALIVAKYLADKVVFVIRWASTAREIARSSTQQLTDHAKVVGVVFNHVVDSEARKYKSYTNLYHYGSGAGYDKYYDS